MKLLRLKLNVPFRSLSAGFEIYFLREWDYGRCFEFHPCCLAGRNGSGKSNVLDALASIFYHMECTSHSPFIISDCQTENVLVFEKNGDGRVESHNPDFNTFGASANSITMKVFGRRETIGDYALSKLDLLKDRLENGGAPEHLIDEARRELGESWGKCSLSTRHSIGRKASKRCSFHTSM